MGRVRLATEGEGGGSLEDKGRQFAGIEILCSEMGIVLVVNELPCGIEC
jgi:hypothetical protein